MSGGVRSEDAEQDNDDRADDVGGVIGGYGAACREGSGRRCLLWRDGNGSRSLRDHDG